MDTIYCNATYDGYLCWPPTPAGETTYQKCPSDFYLIDTSMQAYRRCGADGLWVGRHLNDTSPNGWTNYTPCFPEAVQNLLSKVGDRTEAQLKFETAVNTRTVEMIGIVLSIIGIMLSLYIFSAFPDGDNASDMEIITNNENNHTDANNSQVKDCDETMRRSAEKRKEMEDGTSDERNDDEFITVHRRRAKRMITEESMKVTRNMRVDEKNIYSRNSVDYEVCVTSIDVLPKQIAMAKLLRSENITGIIKIKYKSSFKVLIQFKDKESALKLLECHVLKEKGLRCQLTQDMTMTYGLVKGVDLDLTEEELTKIFESPAEILSVKRLKRLNSDGEWVECESIRVCFKTNSLPPFIYAYDCRFKVESYEFPVTQCNGCWQFGHFIKYCPVKKIICPKCGGDHANCSMENYKCLNCKGDHFVLDKKCPFFVKEKSIRSIMAKEQVTYRRALQLFHEDKQKEKVMREHLNERAASPYNEFSCRQNNYESYRDKLVMGLTREAPISEQNIEQESERSSGETSTILQAPKSKRRNSKKKRDPYDSSTRAMETVIEKPQNKEESGERDSELTYKFEFKKFLLRVKNIILSEGTFEEKIISVFKMMSGELNKFLTNISLHNRRTLIHRNLFCALLLETTIRMLLYTQQAQAYMLDKRTIVENARKGIENLPYICEGVYVLLEYARLSVYAWMFIEGVFLNTMISANTLRNEINVIYFYFGGWMIPTFIVGVWATLTARHFSTEKFNTCWFGYNYLPAYYIINGPIVGILIINTVFLVTVLAVIITKLRRTNDSELEKVKKAIRATLILLPLLGIINIFNLFEYPLEGSSTGFAIWAYGLFISIIYCFTNEEVLKAVKKRWDQSNCVIRWRQRHQHQHSGRTRRHIITISDIPRNDDIQMTVRQWDRPSSTNNVNLSEYEPGPSHLEKQHTATVHVPTDNRPLTDFLSSIESVRSAPMPPRRCSCESAPSRYHYYHRPSDVVLYVSFRVGDTVNLMIVQEKRTLEACLVYLVHTQFLGRGAASLALASSPASPEWASCPSAAASKYSSYHNPKDTPIYIYYNKLYIREKMKRKVISSHQFTTVRKLPVKTPDELLTCKKNYRICGVVEPSKPVTSIQDGLSI
ncbi:hypothetical protein HW555_004263 [Spodoptera exigua]|uniref:Uncharacterized protein n=1 Tax=Spodoptera exigua TaxID=7107 RepID=A0A835GM29_SPOEX|nr:hypothetical protein HW555_004263 [Spodoptera exigua]